MKFNLLLLIAALSIIPPLANAQGAGGAPAIPLVVCHIGKAPQILVPEYVCQWHGGSQHY